MNNNQEILMKKMNLTGLNAEDFILLQAAKNGNKDACAKLYLHHEDEVVRMHRYGPDGKNPKKFGFSQSRNGASYEEASGNCYLCFYNCVHSYDMSSGTPFMAWVRGIFAKRGLDWVNERNPDSFLFEGDQITEFGEEAKGDDRVPETFYAGRFVSAQDFENASADVFRSHGVSYDSFDENEIMNVECLEKVRSYLHEKGDKKLEKFVETYILLGNDVKNPMQAVAEQLGVRRQTAYNYLDSVQVLVKGRFGNHFYGRD